MQISYKHISLALLMLLSGKSLTMSHTPEQWTVDKYNEGLIHCLRFDNNPNFVQRSTALMKNPETFLSNAAQEFLNHYPALKPGMKSSSTVTLMTAGDLVSKSKHTTQPLIRNILLYTLEDTIKEYYKDCNGSQKPEVDALIKFASQKNDYTYEEGIIESYFVELHTAIGHQWDRCKFIPGYVSTAANKIRTCTESCIPQTQNLKPEQRLFSQEIKTVVHHELLKQNISANPEMVDTIYNDVRIKLKTDLLNNVLDHLYTSQEKYLEKFIPKHFKPGSANYQQLDVLLGRNAGSDALLVNSLVTAFCTQHGYVYGTCRIETHKPDLYKLLVGKLYEYQEQKRGPLLHFVHIEDYAPSHEDSV